MIASLFEALNHSPENIPLRLLLAEAYFADGQFIESEKNFRIVLDTDPHNGKAKIGLAQCSFELARYSTTIVILEDLGLDALDVNLKLLLAKALNRNNEPAKAIEIYKLVLQTNPNYKDEELDSLRQPFQASPTTMDSAINSIEDSFGEIDRPKVNFDDVGGMMRVKEEINIKIIQPLQYPDLYRAYGKKIGGGILLYGPPGCGKTHLARATAGQIKAGLVSIGIHDVLEMWLGSSERKLHELFELARRQSPCVMFFDEIDALGASRSDMRQSASKMLINQFLTELDGLSGSNEGVLILGATNAPWHLDSAFRRPGRFDRIIFVQPPDLESRKQILEILLRGKPVGPLDLGTLAKQTAEFSGADIQSMIDRAVEDKLRVAFAKGNPELIQMTDLLRAAKAVKPSTKEWFNTARNYALYSNESGLYDDILEYLKLKK